jgi:protein deglycase
MHTILVHLANGFEEMEAIIPIDVWRRAGYTVKTVSIGSELAITGSHNITVLADQLYENTDYDSADLIFLPGGMPGSKNLDAHTGLALKIKEFHTTGKYVAAICAAPLVLGHNGILQNKRATCFPGFEKELHGATLSTESFVLDGNVLTGKGAGAAMVFALALVEAWSGKEAAIQLATKMQVPA